MKTEFKDNIFTVYPEGRIDSANAEATEAEINKAREENPDGELILDLTALEYISSAGLRVIVMLYKKVTSFGGKLKLIGVNDMIMEILTMTGMVDFLDIEKA